MQREIDRVRKKERVKEKKAKGRKRAARRTKALEGNPREQGSLYRALFSVRGRYYSPLAPFTPPFLRSAPSALLCSALLRSALLFSSPLSFSASASSPTRISQLPARLLNYSWPLWHLTVVAVPVIVPLSSLPNLQSDFLRVHEHDEHLTWNCFCSFIFVYYEYPEILE